MKPKVFKGRWNNEKVEIIKPGYLAIVDVEGTPTLAIVDEGGVLLAQLASWDSDGYMNVLEIDEDKQALVSLSGIKVDCGSMSVLC